MWCTKEAKEVSGDQAGNESVNVTAKHAALHNSGHDGAFPPPSPDGNPVSHIHWLAEEKIGTTHTTS